MYLGSLSQGFNSDSCSMSWVLIVGGPGFTPRVEDAVPLLALSFSSAAFWSLCVSCAASEITVRPRRKAIANHFFKYLRCIALQPGTLYAGVPSRLGLPS